MPLRGGGEGGQGVTDSSHRVIMGKTVSSRFLKCF